MFANSCIYTHTWWIHGAPTFLLRRTELKPTFGKYNRYKYMYICIYMYTFDAKFRMSNFSCVTDSVQMNNIQILFEFRS